MRPGTHSSILKALAVPFLALALSCAGDNPNGNRTYDNNDLELSVGNAAFMACQCIFVMEMPEAFCEAWVKASPAVARFSIDREHKTVESSAFVSWAASARFIDEKRGCALE